MGRPRNNPDECRHGKHRKDQLRIQMTTSRETKAILIYTAALLDKTLTDMLLGEGLKVAKALGIIDENGNVTSEHKSGVSISMDILESQKGDK